MQDQNPSPAKKLAPSTATKAWQEIRVSFAFDQLGPKSPAHVHFRQDHDFRSPKTLLASLSFFLVVGWLWGIELISQHIPLSPTVSFFLYNTVTYLILIVIVSFMLQRWRKVDPGSWLGRLPTCVTPRGTTRKSATPKSTTVASYLPLSDNQVLKLLKTGGLILLFYGMLMFFAVAGVDLLAKFPNSPLRGMPTNQVKLEQGLSYGLGHYWYLALFMLQVLIIAPLCEELALRRFVQGLVWRNSLLGVVLPAVGFALLHATSNSWQLLSYFLPGLVFGLLYRHTESFALVVLMHFLLNLRGLILLWP